MKAVYTLYTELCNYFTHAHKLEDIQAVSPELVRVGDQETRLACRDVLLTPCV